jgi:RNA polymerase sigma factor (sigma-70 family)
MMNPMVSDAAVNDAELVGATLAGDRDAFAQIVARYQSLICSLAYSATGSLGQSEDLAQETFVAAWKQLRDLREPEKLRAWLCGIARNLINNSLRKQRREPSHAAESIDITPESHSPEPLPIDHTITNEEQAILWRSLERIPETYREPLVLFYREHQSVEAVAEKLELSPETVHQRLSRGRKLLAGEVTAFVEGALARTNPGQAFTLGALAALPVTLASSGKAAALAAAAQGGATVTGKSLAVVVLGILASPLLGFFAALLGWRESLKLTRAPRERALIKRFGLMIVAGGILFFAACSMFASYLSPRLWDHHASLVIALGWVICLSWAVFAFGYSWRHKCALARLRAEEREKNPDLFRDELPPRAWEYRSRATFLGLPLVHWRSWGRVWKPGEKVPPAIGWIACGERAYGILYASGGLAVGGIITGGLGIGLISFGGASIGLLALGGFALGAVALGGGAIGIIASGGMALGWHAALGGMVASHDLACGGAALGKHVNDSVAREFFLNHPWFNMMNPLTQSCFWLLCFGPIFVQIIFWIRRRRKMERRATPD